ncbi:MAG: PQQ-binding-like beta-propeller repeat protein [Candidatus Lightella neohaematopini]|nr:PQQ-binding-like beta-propeller repeat protein [Candidatus Lightella neohaematopini]
MIKHNVNVFILTKYFILLVSILVFDNCTISNKSNKEYLTNSCNYFIKWKIIFSHNKKNLSVISNSKYVIITNNKIIQVIDINNGKKIWSRNFLYYTHYKSFNNLRLIRIYLVNNSIYLFTSRAEIYAVNVHNGNLIWYTKTVAPITSKLILANHLLIIYSDNILQAINENNGITKWMTSFYSNIISSYNAITPVSFFGIIVIFGSDGVISAVSLDQGNIIWHCYITAIKNKIVDIICNQIEPIIIGSTIYSIDINNNLIALNLYSGKILWTTKIYVISNLLYYNDYIYCIDDKHNLTSINVFTGKVILKNKIYLLYNTTVFLMYKYFLIIGNCDGYIYIFNILKCSVVCCMQINSFIINKIFLLKKDNFLVLLDSQIINIIVNTKY